MRRIVFLALITLAISLGWQAVALAGGPNPAQDIKVGVYLFKPGCNFIDYQFAVKNTSTQYEYRIVRTGTAALSCDFSSSSCSAPSSCCGGSPCSRTWPGDEDLLLYNGSGQNCA